MSSGAQESTIKIARSSDYVRSCYVSTPGGGSLASRGLAGTCSHCRDSSGLYNCLAGLRSFPEWRKMVGTLTKKEWAYA